MIDGKKIATTLEVSCARFSGATDGWMLRVTDARSRTLVCEAELSWEEFGRLMGSQVEVSGTLYQSAHFGLRMETRRIDVPMCREDFAAIPDSFWARAEEIAGEGWRVDRETANGHRYRDGKYTVTARRWVTP